MNGIYIAAIFALNGVIPVKNAQDISANTVHKSTVSEKTVNSWRFKNE